VQRVFNTYLTFHTTTPHHTTPRHPQTTTKHHTAPQTINKLEAFQEPEANKPPTSRTRTEKATKKGGIDVCFNIARCAFFDRNFHSGMSLVPTPARLKL
jgi:hypothetical protein